MLEMLKTRKEQLEAEGKSGFTLMEMLIVIAIIAILIAIAIPLFASQMESARESTDAANLRSAYAVGSAHLLAHPTETEVYVGPVTMTQTGDWDSSDVGEQTIGGEQVKNCGIEAGKEAYVHITRDENEIEVDFEGSVKSGLKPLDPIQGTK